MSERRPPGSPESAMIAFACLRCGQKMQVPEQYAGKPVRCPGCKHVLKAPAPVPAATVALPRIAGQPSSLA